MRNKTFINGAGNTSKSVWTVIKRETGRQTKHVESKITPNEFNNFFLTIAKKIEDTLPNPTIDLNEYLKKVQVNERTMFLSPVCREDVMYHINKLQSKTAKDIDDIDVRLVKTLKHQLAAPLLEVINSCLGCGVFPNKMKIARVVPVHKKGDPSILNHYRPIAILPTFSKILESIILEQMTSYIVKNNYLSGRQYGFVRGRNTADAIKSLVTYIIEAFEDRNVCIAQFCDLTRAFDCVSHTLCLKKMEYYGIRGVTLSLVEAYLTGRYQVVEKQHERSTMQPVQLGIPQGSILGPFIFLLYINDLSYNLNCHTILFADDTTLATKDLTKEKAQMKIDQFSKEAKLWFDANRLCLNETKTAITTFSSARVHQEPQTATFLGITLDSRLTWKHHVESMSVALSKGIYAIRRIRQIIDSNAAVKTYYALFHSRMTYGIGVWGSSVHAVKILAAQKRAVRSIVAAPPDSHCRPFFRMLKILTVPAAYILKVTGETHLQLGQYEKRSDVHNYSLRTADSISVPHSRLNTHKKMNINVTLYNKLPIGWRRDSTKVLKNKLKAFLVDLAPYSVNEFLETTIR